MNNEQESIQTNPPGRSTEMTVAQSCLSAFRTRNRKIHNFIEYQDVELHTEGNYCHQS